MSLHEIVLPETKPETEWILGHAVQKVSPFRKHARLQLTFGAALLAWAEGRGEGRLVAGPGQHDVPEAVQAARRSRAQGVETLDLGAQSSHLRSRGGREAGGLDLA